MGEGIKQKNVNQTHLSLCVTFVPKTLKKN